jgi:hypothetical protein
MSGGKFNYDQERIVQIAEQIHEVIINNDNEERDKYGDRIWAHYEPDEIEEFRRAIKALRIAYVYALRVDWFMSGDDGPESFRKRLAEDLAAIEAEYD